MTKFSKRLGYSVKEKEITIKEDAPQELREFIVMTVYELEYQPSFLRDTICKVLKKALDKTNWSEYPNIDGEVQKLISGCEWYFVYDIIEAVVQRIKTEH